MFYKPWNRLLRFSIRRRGVCTVRSALDSAIIDELGLSDADLRNPTISTSYRRAEIPQPNKTVLEAQAKVCTGPEQTKPLSEEQMVRVLDTILRSGELLASFSLVENSCVLSLA